MRRALRHPRPLAVITILMETCQNFAANTPLAGWTTDFAGPDGVGRLKCNRAPR